jgi:HEAT repeat protein
MTDRTVEWVLLAALRDVLPEVRIQAASGLSSIRSIAAVPRLIDVLRHDEPWVSARVADQLVRYGPDAVPLLLQALRHGTEDGPLDSASMQLVSRVLGLIGDLRACSVLRERLRDPIPEVRIAAASALGSSGTISAVPDLLDSLRDDDWRVRARAASSLATFSHPDSLRPLADAVEDESWWVRQNAAEALTEIPGGFAALVDVIESGSEPAREAAVTHLGLSGAIRSARDRTERGDNEPWERRLIELVDAKRRLAS